MAKMVANLPTCIGMLWNDDCVVGRTIRISAIRQAAKTDSGNNSMAGEFFNSSISNYALIY